MKPSLVLNLLKMSKIFYYLNQGFFEEYQREFILVQKFTQDSDHTKSHLSMLVFLFELDLNLFENIFE
jgi:hypothetical protein